VGRNAARRFQKELNEIVEENVPLRFLPLWKKITIKMQKVIKKHFKKNGLLGQPERKAKLWNKLSKTDQRHLYQNKINDFVPPNFDEDKITLIVGMHLV
jgi:hypothetical protein